MFLKPDLGRRQVFIAETVQNWWHYFLFFFFLVPVQDASERWLGRSCRAENLSMHPKILQL